MLLNQALPDGFSMAELNQRYQYTFSEGAYCIFCVREAALGIENQQERISQAAKQALSYVSSDYELITWNGLVFCICGADERDALLSTVYALFEHLTAENPGVWTMASVRLFPPPCRSTIVWFPLSTPINTALSTGMVVSMTRISRISYTEAASPCLPLRSSYSLKRPFIHKRPLQ